MLLRQSWLNLADTSGMKKVRTKETIPTERGSFRRRPAQQQWKPRRKQETMDEK